MNFLVRVQIRIGVRIAIIIFVILNVAIGSERMVYVYVRHSQKKVWACVRLL